MLAYVCVIVRVCVGGRWTNLASPPHSERRSAVARRTPRERLYRTRLVSLRNNGTYVGTIAVDLRRQQWRARPPINAHSVQAGSEVAPIDSEIERALSYALKYARV